MAFHLLSLQPDLKPKENQNRHALDLHLLYLSFSVTWIYKIARNRSVPTRMSAVLEGKDFHHKKIYASAHTRGTKRITPSVFRPRVLAVAAVAIIPY